MRLLLLTCSESAAIDRNTNRFSIFNIVEEIYASNFPAAYPQLSIGALFARDPGDQDARRLRLRITLGSAVLLEGDLQVDFQDHDKCRALATIAGLIIPSPGTMNVALLDDSVPVGAWDVVVRHIGEAQVIPQSTGPAEGETARN
jgi:hypothetical protein